MKSKYKIQCSLDSCPTRSGSEGRRVKPAFSIAVECNEYRGLTIPTRLAELGIEYFTCCQCGHSAEAAEE